MWGNSAISVRKLMRHWDAVRAGWPMLVIPFAGSLFIINTGQGQEALYAMTQLSRSGTAFMSFVLCGMILHASFIQTTNIHYPFSTQAIYTNATVPRIALFAAAAMPLVFGLWFFFQIATSHPFHILGTPWSPRIGFALCAAAVVLLWLWHVLSMRRFIGVIQTHTSRFLVFAGIWRWLQTLLLLSLFVAAIVIWVSPEAASRVGPIAVFAIGMTMWSVVAGYAIAWASQREWMPSPLLTGLACFALVGFAAALVRNVHYPVATLACAKNAGCSSAALVDVDSHAERWLLQRAQSGSTVDAIVVIADGGGIRAALQTATILAELDRMSRGAFFDKVYAMSGVSGGAVGLATYIAERAHASSAPSADELTDVETALKADHFSPMLSGLVLRDIPDMLIPLSILRASGHPLLADRSTRFEASLGDDWAGGSEMNADVLGAIGRSAHGKEQPIVLFDATSANGGTIEVVSNVHFLHRSDSEPLCNVLDRLETGATLSLAAAAHLSARFPFFDAPGEITVASNSAAQAGCSLDAGTFVDYVDGGYADNTGAVAALSAVEALARAESSAALKSRYPHLDVKLTVIHIYASSNDLQDQRAIAAAGRQMQTLDDFDVPMHAVGAVRSELGLAPLKALCLAISRRDRSGSWQDCIRMRALQNRQSEADDAVMTRFVRDKVQWINAALFVSDDRAAPSYVPLGWMLGPSACYVQKESEKLGLKVAQLLRFQEKASFRPCAAEKD